MILTVTLNAAVDKRYELEGFTSGAVNRVSDCKMSAGGKGLNVSRVAALMGEQVVATGFVGGHTGALIEKLAAEDGITTDFTYVNAESRTCINIFDKVTGIQTEVLEGGLKIPKEKQEEFIRNYKILIQNADVAAISGSVPKGVDASLYRRMIEIAANLHKPLLLDTSGQTLCECVKTAPTLIKPNQDEIVQLTGLQMKDEASLIEAGQRLQASGIKYVVISLGKDGSLMISENGVFKATVPKLDAVNTVGCGDAMLAALAYGLCRQWTEEELLCHASAVSAANALHERTGYFEEAVYKNLYPQIQIEKIK